MVLVLIGFYLHSMNTKRTAGAPVAKVENRGIAKVIDGDTIELNGVRHRLFGIDAPDQNGSAGEYYAQSAVALQTAAQYEWICEDTGTRSRDRIVSVCRFALDGVDVSEWMVLAGYAVDWPSFSGGRYAQAQLKAQAEKIGIWQTYETSWR